MTTDRKLETAVEMCLPPEARRRLETLMAAQSDDFVALVRAAGLDPKTSFRGKVLRIDFGDADLNGFDFSGADLSGCDLSHAKLDGAIMTGARCGVDPRLLELHGHDGPVESVSYSPDGRRIISGGHDRKLRLWDAADGKALGDPLRGNEGLVLSAAFSPDGRHIASAGRDSDLRLWDANTMAALPRQLSGHDGTVYSVAFSPDGSRIVSGGKDGTTRLWNAALGKTLRNIMRGHVGGVRSVAFSPDGSRVVSGGSDKTLRLWDADTGAPMGEPLHGHVRGVRSVAFSPDGSRIVSGGDDGTLRLWDADTGAPQSELLGGNRWSAFSVAFSPDGSQIVSGGDDGTLRLWDVATGTTLGKPLYMHKGGVKSVIFSPDGSHIVSGGEDGKIIVWFLDPPVRQVFATTRPEDQAYTRNLLNKLFAHPEMIKRNVVEAALDPLTHPRPDEAARIALENSVAALFIVGDKDLAFIQNGELELARRLQRKTGRPRIIPVFISSAISTEPPEAIKDYHFVHMPLDKPAAFDALVEAICQAVDSPSNRPIAALPDETLTLDATETQEPRSAEKLTDEEITAQRRLKLEISELEKARRTGNYSVIKKLL